MTLDTRARHAAQGIHRAVAIMETSTPTESPGNVERFDRFRDRKQRNRRIGAILVAAMLAIAAIVATKDALERSNTKVPVGPLPRNGRIVFGEQGGDGVTDPLFTMNPDGTDVRALSVESRCVSWAPDATKILIGVADPSTNEIVGAATINPDGSGYRELGANGRTQGCGAFSPDGTRIVLGGSIELEPDHYLPGEHGIFSVRASDGGDLVRLTPRNGTNPSYSPDGTQIVFQGVQGPQGACVPRSPAGGGTGSCPPGTDRRIGELDGSILVVNADGTGLHRIASSDASTPRWSPDGRWILFSDVHDIDIVHPDGTGLRRITLESAPKLRGLDDLAWSPDGTRFAFVAGSGFPWTNIFTARSDGSDVEQITHTRGIYYRGTDWGTDAG